MKKFFKGYTLTEVLVCVAIVGIAAALVLPSLVNNSRDKVNVATLARAVELIQNGMTNIMQEAQNHSEDDVAAANLASIQLSDIFEDGGDAFITDDDNLFAETRGIMGTELVDDYVINNIRNYSGGALANGMLTNTTAYRFTKTTPVVIFQNVPADNIANAEDDDVITRIFIDANGSSGPNQIGRDVFLFGLTNSGIVVPAGSEAYNKNIFNEEIALYQDGCGDEITDGLPCAARVMAEKWNINY